MYNTWKNGPTFTVKMGSNNMDIVAKVPNNMLLGLNFTENFN